MTRRVKVGGRAYVEGSPAHQKAVEAEQETATNDRLKGLELENIQLREAAKGMSAMEAVQMMRRCREEIRTLRRQIEALQPKAEAYDNMSRLISVAIRPAPVGMGDDVCWQLEKRIAELEKPAA